MSDELSRIITFPVPADLLQPRIALRVRSSADAPWTNVPLHLADSMSLHPHAHGGCEAWGSFCADGPIECEVTFEQPIALLRIRPSLHAPITFDYKDNVAWFTLNRPRYVVVESGPVRATTGLIAPRFTLYLTVDPPDDAAPSPTDAGVKVLEPGTHDPIEFDPGAAHTVLLLPGVHEVVGQRMSLLAGKTLYLSGGAYLRSYIFADEADDASIRGRGVIDGTGVECKSREWRDDGYAAFVFFRRGRNITLDGPAIYNSPFWNIVTFGTTGMTIRNHKAITWKMNNDGVQPRSCNQLLVEHCFLKCADDCIAVKTRRTAGMSSRDLVFRDLVLWNDKPGNCVEIGHTSQADVLERVVFEDIDLVHCDTANPNDGFAVSISVIDHCLVRDVVYRNFRIEGVRSGDFRFWIGTSRYTTDAERGHIREVTIDGYEMETEPTFSIFQGADPSHRIEKVQFSNVIEHASGTDRRRCRHARDLHLQLAFAHEPTMID